MGDMREHFDDLKQARRERRAELGIACPECRRLLPRADAKILLPGRWCKRRGHIYQDPRIAQ